MLTRFNKSCVSPVLQEYDNKAFRKAVAQSSWPYDSFQPMLNSFPTEVLTKDWTAEVWHLYRPWALVRATGRLPLRCFGYKDMPNFLLYCPLCGTPYADVQHALSSCGGCTDLRSKWLHSAGLPVTPSWPILSQLLFAERDGPDHRILYVGQFFERINNELLQSQAIDRLIDHASGL